MFNSMCLIKIVEDNKFWIHDQLSDLGREIVYQGNQMSSGKRRRLWTHERIPEIEVMIWPKQLENANQT